jgi:plasmid stability protein
MSNITLSIDDETIKHAKIKAVQDGVSLSAKVRELLKRYVSGQLDQATPDLSFVQNALLFSAKTGPEVNEPVATARNDTPPPLDANGITVNADYLRSIRGWAREDLYDRPTNYGKSAK